MRSEVCTVGLVQALYARSAMYVLYTGDHILAEELSPRASVDPFRNNVLQGAKFCHDTYRSLCRSTSSSSQAGRLGG
jgi:hypothetical protein